MQENTEEPFSGPHYGEVTYTQAFVTVSLSKTYGGEQELMGTMTKAYKSSFFTGKHSEAGCLGVLS